MPVVADLQVAKSKPRYFVADFNDYHKRRPFPGV